jgi:PAS domain S-box-containing protein
VVLTVAAGLLAFLGDSPVKGLILGAVGFVVAYDAALAFLIKAGRVKTAFLIGFLLDHVVLLGVWWQTLQQATDSSPNDLWLILFPVIVGVVVRVGWAVGGAYSVLLVAWMAFADIRYQAAGSYPVEQLPLRAVFLVLVAALTSVLVYQLQSARRRAERESETLSAVQRSMTEALVVVDTQGVVEFCNPAAAALMGTTLDAARGRPLAEVLVGTGSDTRAEGLLEAMQGLLDAPSDAPCTAAVVMERPSAQHLTITAFPITAHKDELLTGLLIRDVTEQWELEQRQYGFVSIAAHELRTPLTSVMGFSELLQTRSVGEETRNEWLGHILAESRRLTSILDELMRVSRIQSGKTTLELGPVDLVALVDAVVADAIVTMPGRNVEVVIPADVPQLHGDAGKLKQVLINLVSNGLKYSPGGGIVRVSARVDAAASEIVFDVSDEGVGIAERDGERLFTTFYRIRTAETEGIRGTGLGLFISRYLVSLMAGRIWFESTPQQGSTFSFALPLDLTEAAANADGPPSSFVAAA